MFRAGSSAFQAGEHAKALAAFEQALAAGMSGPAIHFNIGVAAYRVGNYARAAIAFEEAAGTPAMAALACYNLGLVELARHDSDAAARWFSRAAQSSADPKLQELAASRLAELRPTQPASRAKTWVGYAALGLGYDDNVALLADAEVLGISDSKDYFREAQLALSTPLADSWRIDGGLMLLDYQDLDSFDQMTAYAGARYRWVLGAWTNDAGARLGYSTIDGAGFENRRTLSLQTSRAVRSDLRVRGRYSFHHLQGLNEYKALSGRRQDLSARLEWTPDDWQAGAEYLFEIADYDDATLSAKRRHLRIDFERALNADWFVSFEATRRRSNYDSDASGSEERTELALTLTRTITLRWLSGWPASWSLLLRHAYIDNKAELREFDYKGHRIFAGVETTF